MITDIQKSSFQYLNSIFSPLDTYRKYVFWIRNREMTRQIYMGANYENIWQRQANIIYDVPLIFFNYLLPEYLIFSMKQFSARHDNSYQKPEDNLAFYQIFKENNEIGYIRCQCFKCVDFNKEYYILGFAESIEPQIWFSQTQQNNFAPSQEHVEIKKQFFYLLKTHFGITPVAQLSSNQSLLHNIHTYIHDCEKINFTMRELECLSCICLGKTAKQTAKEMGNISPRTVETYIENIKKKTGCINKSGIISKFARYFLNFKMAI